MKAIFPHEKFSFVHFLRMWSKNVLNDAAQAMKRGVFLKNITSIVVFRLMQFWGTYRGYAQVGLISKSLRRKFYYPSDISGIENQQRHPKSKRTAIDYSSDSREFDSE